MDIFLQSRPGPMRPPLTPLEPPSAFRQAQHAVAGHSHTGQFPGCLFGLTPAARFVEQHHGGPGCRTGGGLPRPRLHVTGEQRHGLGGTAAGDK